MLRVTPKGPDLWDSLLPEASRALPEDLAHVDALLQDSRFIEPFVRRFDERAGRPGLPVATYLRLMYLRFKNHLSYEALADAVRGNVQWRTFCGIGCQDRVPDPSTLARLSSKYGEESLTELCRLVSEDIEQWRVQRRPRGEADARTARRSGRAWGKLAGIGPALVRWVTSLWQGAAARIRELRTHRQVQLPLDLKSPEGSSTDKPA